MKWGSEPSPKIKNYIEGDSALHLKKQKKKPKVIVPLHNKKPQKTPILIDN